VGLIHEKTEGRKSRDAVPLFKKNHRGTSNNRKFDLKTLIFLKMDKFKKW
jgi:hypothetical protein